MRAVRDLTRNTTAVVDTCVSGAGRPSSGLIDFSGNRLFELSEAELNEAIAVRNYRVSVVRFLCLQLPCLMRMLRSCRKLPCELGHEKARQDGAPGQRQGGSAQGFAGPAAAKGAPGTAPGRHKHGSGSPAAAQDGPGAGGGRTGDRGREAQRHRCSRIKRSEQGARGRQAQGGRHCGQCEQALDDGAEPTQGCRRGRGGATDGLVTRRLCCSGTHSAWMAVI